MTGDGFSIALGFNDKVNVTISRIFVAVALKVRPILRNVAYP